jgi:hypothetical protein
MFGIKKPRTVLPVDEILAMIRSADLKPERKGDTIRFRSYHLETCIRFADQNLQTHDGLWLDQIVSVHTDVPGLEKSTADFLCAMNALAGLSALVQVNGCVSLVSRVPIYRGENAVREYAHLIASTAMVQSVWLRQFGAYVQSAGSANMTPPDFPQFDDPCRWGKTDFQAIADLLRQRQMASTDGETGMASEFPWEAGAVSAMFHHRTSLFEMCASRNPLLGNGIFYKLELPAVFEEKEVPLIAAAMNVGELNATDAPPFFGAWCAAKDGGRIAFVGFQPNFLRSIGMHTSVAFWSLARSAMSKELLEEAVGCA